MLVGRAEFLERSAALVRDARAGVPGVLAVVGAAGTGKTALLDETIAAGDGVTVLRAVGVPAEESLGYGALSVLLAAIGDDIERLPAHLGRALRSAFGLVDASVAALAVGTAVVELLSAASQRRALLVVVDDLQWIDADTRQVLGFVARRLAGQSVAILLAARTSECLPYGLPPAWQVDDLSAAESRDVLHARAPDLIDDVAAVLADQCGGNPLVLLEALARLSPEQRRGHEPLDALVPLPQSVARSFLDRVDRLDRAAQTALLLIVCEGQGDLQLIAQLGPVESIDTLRTAGLVVTDGLHVRVQHPLLTAAVSERASTPDLQQAHEALASALEHVDPDRSLWHRARSVFGPDESLSAAMTALAQRRRRQGAPVAAAKALERAAELAVDHAQRADLLADAASAALDGGQAALALALVNRSEAVGADRPRGQVVRARLARLQGRYGDAAELLGCAADRLPTAEQRDALVERLWVALDAGRTEVVGDTVRRLAANESTPPDLVAAASALFALDLHDADTPAGALSRLRGAIAKRPPDDASPELLGTMARAANYSGNLALAERLELRVSRVLRAQGNPLGAAEAMGRAAFLAYVLGRWNAAEARCVDLDQLVDEGFAPAVVADGLLLRADIAAAQGREQTCRDHCRRLRGLGESLSGSHTAVMVDRREAALEMGLQNWDEALALLLRSADELARSEAWHPYLSPVPELVEVLVRLGRADEAAFAAEGFLTRIGPAAPPQTRARALRIRGLLASPDEADEFFTESAALDGQVGMLFQQARTQLCHGEWLRRARRRSHAQAVLTEAFTTFRRLGAVPWQARAEGELSAGSASSADPTSAPTPVAELLTPRELQIAVFVSEGRRNKEISAAMFLSLRTVEFHLSNVYRKLGVTGRTQLVAYLAAS